MSSTVPTNESEKLRLDAELTRAELADTVDALAAKADVKARVREHADAGKAQAQQKAQELATQAQQKAQQLGSQAQQKAQELGGQAQQIGAQARERPAVPAAVLLALLAALLVVLRVRRTSGEDDR